MRGLSSGVVPEAVSITLPRGEVPVFQIETGEVGQGWAEATVRKDAGDDPDVTHDALIRVRVAWASSGSGIVFCAGSGVGTVTKPGLPLAVGEPAINPVPRLMIEEALRTASDDFVDGTDLTVTVGVDNGTAIAAKTWNPRLGIVGGLSILGTTGIVRPYSCAAWIASIHRGIDVARAAGHPHVMGATGATSERAARALHGLPETACLDMGDFAGGLLKYLRTHPVARFTMAGGFAKMTKLAQGALDLHSARSQVDHVRLARMAEDLGLPSNKDANTAMEALGLAGPHLAMAVARDAHGVVMDTLRKAEVVVDVVVVDRNGAIVAHHAP